MRIAGTVPSVATLQVQLLRVMNADKSQDFPATQQHFGSVCQLPGRPCAGYAVRAGPIRALPLRAQARHLERSALLAHPSQWGKTYSSARLQVFLIQFE